MEWIKKLWGSWVGKSATFLAFASLAFTAFGQITNAFQHHQQVKGAEAMMRASCTNAIYDCDRLLNKYKNLEGSGYLPVSQFKYNLMSLKNNEETLQKTSLTVLGKRDLQNFQTYNQDLNITIVQIRNSLGILKKDSGDFYNKKGETLKANEPFYHVTKSQAQIAIDNLVRLRDNFRYDLEKIEKHQLIADDESNDQQFEKDNYKWLQKSRDRYQFFLKNYYG